MHSLTLFFRDAASESWFTAEGLPKPEALIEAINNLAEDRVALHSPG